MNNIHDLRVLIVNGFLISFSFSNVETGLKILSLLLAVCYTARRWWLMEKNKKNEKIKENLDPNHNGHYYDAIFLDLEMPILNGHEACKSI